MYSSQYSFQYSSRVSTIVVFQYYSSIYQYTTRKVHKRLAIVQHLVMHLYNISQLYVWLKCFEVTEVEYYKKVRKCLAIKLIIKDQTNSTAWNANDFM